MANRYWVGGTGTWDASSTANWSATTGGAAGASAPVAADIVFFDANSGSGTCTVDTGATCTNATLDTSTLTLLLNANFQISGQFTLTAGTLNLSTYSFTCGTFSSSNTNNRTLNFGTGKIVVTGNNGNVWFVNDPTNFNPIGTKTVEATYSGAVGTRTFAGGAGGTAATSVNFKINAGSDTVAITSNAIDVDFTGFSGTFSNATRNIRGSLTLSSAMTLAAGTSVTTFAATSGGNTIFSGSKTIDFPLTFNGVGGSWTLQDNLTLGATRALTLTNGTLNAGNKNVSTGTFALGAGTKTLTLGSGTWTVAGASWNANTNATGLTVSPSTATISMTSASTKTFSGGGFTWPTLNQGGAGALTIQQSNTFANIANTVQPATVTLTAGTTQTVTAFTLSGASGNLITLNSSTAGSQATLTDSSNVNSVSFVGIKDIVAAGYSEWRAYTSNGNVDNGNNTGWVFTAPTPLLASEYQISLKSFTERRSF